MTTEKLSRNIKNQLAKEISEKLSIGFPEALLLVSVMLLEY